MRKSFGQSLSKFGNTKVEYDGHKFDSKKECEYYKQLKVFEKAGQISNLELQPVFLLQEKYRDVQGKAVREITYIADFRYIETCSGKSITIDVKGLKTEVYKLKKKLLLFKYKDLNFKEVY